MCNRVAEIFFIGVRRFEPLEEGGEASFLVFWRSILQTIIRKFHLLRYILISLLSTWLELKCANPLHIADITNVVPILGSETNSTRIELKNLPYSCYCLASIATKQTACLLESSLWVSFNANSFYLTRFELNVPLDHDGGSTLVWRTHNMCSSGWREVGYNIDNVAQISYLVIESCIRSLRCTYHVQLESSWIIELVAYF